MPRDSRPEGGKGRGAASDAVRLDQALVARGLAETRTQAQNLVLAGQIRVEGEPALKPSQLVGPDQRLEVTARPTFVSRGGEKLAAALDAFSLSPRGKTCADVGASTGGFTDCLLQRGAARVFAVDVGRGILHWKLRTDPRVVVLERTNARHLTELASPVDFVTIDVAFISLRHILPAVAGWLGPRGDVVALVKPQFEAGRGMVGKGGVVRDPEVHRRVLQDVLGFCVAAGLRPRGVIRSPLRGPKGNIEFLLWSVKGAPPEAVDEPIDLALVAGRRDGP